MSNSERIETTNPTLAINLSMLQDRSVILVTADGMELKIRYQDYEHFTVTSPVTGRHVATVYTCKGVSARHMWGHSDHESGPDALAYIARAFDADRRCEEVA